jgi:hypothetical protein
VKFSLRPVLEPLARALQKAYARAIRSSGPRVPHDGARGPAGGSLSQDVQRPTLVRFERWGFVFSPSRLGLRFSLWWRGTSRQRARGRSVSFDVGKLAREVEDELGDQVRSADRRIR